MMPIRTSPLNDFWRRIRRSARALRRDRRGVAAIEFAMIFPLMLVAFFGTVEFCSAIAIDRKVTLIARTLSDLTSQQASAMASAGITGIFIDGLYIINAYSPTPMKAQVSEIYVDSNGKAKIQWSQGATYRPGAVTLASSTRNAGDDVTTVVPAALLVKQTYLIFSEVSYQYVPVVTWGLMGSTGIALSDVSYTRPRQDTCVTYNNLPAGNCPLS
jgi:Flp pilus assembly protein TadG